MKKNMNRCPFATLKDLAKARGLEGDFYFEKAGTDRAHAQKKTKRKRRLQAVRNLRILNTDRKSPPEKKTVFGNHVLLMIHQKERIIRNVQSTPARIRRRQPSLTAARKQMAFWKYFRMDMDLFAVPIICRVRMTFMYLRPRSGVLT